ncbi:L-malyl-CoA/beta-methylmalyl-CoA lyase [Natranaeroarchaeum aerophilus]|uniref:Aldolase/citrate lyase family protein n=1 Tax=Natranaeroarchaeum aerophilus TaxID=2917711 RepID=A0AAE3FRN9_9EURY|nr:L-malyl-CoA/beta-methylmalyl-CoA lyase [Natranaeroarchaeum aerophilus]MCL9813845.1 aldolase/citrate lyase family protein [Natranaeroarchaeum aerophilus]
MTRLCRTFQTAPAAVPREDSAKYLRSGLTAEGFQLPDWLVPDLEDGTAPEMKDTALENTIELVDEHASGFPGEIWPRVQWGYDDEATRERGRQEIETLVRSVGDRIDGVVVPKVGRVEDVRAAASAIEEYETSYGHAPGSIELAVIVESARAVSDLDRIARLGDGRLAALVFGPVDYTAELGGRELDDGRPTWPGLLERLSNEASAGGLLAVGGPFDQLYRERAGVQFYNGDAYAEQVEREATVGLDGSWSLHPNQTAQANRIHMPRESELRQDVERIEAFEEAKSTGTGAVSVDGQMVDEATFKNFANTVETVRRIDETRPEQTAARYDDGLLGRALDLETSW